MKHGKPRSFLKSVCAGALALITALPALSGIPSLEASAGGATYAIRIDGVSVTDGNRNDILGNGVFSYDDKLHRLIISGDYTFSGQTDASIVLAEAGLTVYTAEDSTLNAVNDTMMIFVGEPAVFTGPGRLSLIAPENTESHPMYILNTSVEFDHANVYMQAPETMTGQGAWLYFKDSVIELDASSNAIYGDFNYTMDDDCYFADPPTCVFKNNHVWGFDADHNRYQVKHLKIDCQSGHRFPLVIAKVPVTDLNMDDILGNGNFFYLPDCNTLCIAGSYSAGYGVPLVTAQPVYRGPRLTIHIQGTCELKTDHAAVFDLQNDDTFVTGDGPAHFKALDHCAFVVHENGSLTLSELGAEITDSSIGIYGEGVNNHENQANLTISHSALIFDCDFCAIFNMGGSFAMQGSSTTEDITITDDALGRYYTYNNAPGSTTPYAGNVTVFPGILTEENYLILAEQYYVEVGHVAVNEWNYQDILGNGVFRYDPDRKQLEVFGDYKVNQHYVIHSDSRRTMLDICYHGDVSLINNLSAEPAIKSESDTLRITSDYTGGVLTLSGICGSNQNNNLEIYNSSLDLETSGEAQNSAISGFDSVTMDLCGIAEPVNAEYDTDQKMLINIDTGEPVMSAKIVCGADPVVGNPQDQCLPIGKTAVFTVPDAGTGATYQWQNYTSSGWKDSGLATAKTASLSVPVTAARDGYRYRCIVRSIDNIAKVSEPAKLTVQTAITAQPVSVTQAIGTTATFTVTATGAGTLNYQWQCNTGSGFKNSTASGAKTATLSIPVAAQRNGYKYRCIVTSPNGTKATSNTVTLKVKTAITTQPKNYTGAIGTTAKFSVAATGAGILSYQWQNYTSSGWKNSGLATAQTAELSVPVTAARNGYKYRCVVTSDSGSIAISNSATLTVKVSITAQPKNVTDIIGATAKFTVTASGASTLRYQWQCDTGSGFKDSTASGAKTATLSIPVAAQRDGFKYRCIVTSSNLTSVTSNTAVLKVQTAVKTQPKNVTAVIGATTKFTVTATGAGTLSYQWQCDIGKGFKDSTASGAKTATLNIPVAAQRDGYKYRCIVTSANGTTATSNTATLKVKPAITAQPQNYSGAVGTTAKFTVTATGAGELSYQWQNYTSSGWKDSGLATAKTAELTVPVTAARNGYKYRCIVTASNGTKATSDAATLTVE